jgi:hypothetical protein
VLFTLLNRGSFYCRRGRKGNKHPGGATAVTCMRSNKDAPKKFEMRVNARAMGCTASVAMVFLCTAGQLRTCNGLI